MKRDFTREVQNKYRSLLRAGRNYLSRKDQQDIRVALNMAIEAYGRKETSFGEPIILHSLSVARMICQQMELGRVSIIGALLHDAGPYLSEHRQEIQDRFGDQVLQVLEGLEKIQDLHTEKTKYQAEIFRKLLLQLAADIRVILIKLVERLDEMRKLEKASENIRLTVSSETYYLYAPLAHRLGLYNLKSEMEDLHLKYTHTEMYEKILSRLRNTTSSRNKLIRDFLKPVKERLDKEGLEYVVKSRTKSIHSIWKKMKAQQVDFDEVYDLFAIRIILKAEREREKSVCWQTYSVVTDLYQPNPKRMRDWISVPRSNGYESLHTTVVGPRSKWVEVQIRTERMDEIAEKGYAAHFRYKDSDDRGGMDTWLLRMREILELPAGETTDEFFDQVKSGLYADEVFVFTPKGDLKQLQAGATLLDFAFEIHTAVGEQCMGGKVNGRNVPIKYELKNGDQVSILTSKNQKPKSDWLSFVVTSKARSRIKQLVNEEENKRADEGKEILQRRLKNWKIPFDDKLIRRLLKHYSCKTGKELYCQIADEVINLPELKEVVQQKEEVSVSPSQPEEKGEKSVDTEDKTNYADLLIIEDRVKNLDYRMAKCCNPVNGDPIFGFVTVDEGIKIHRTNCPNASSLLTRYPYRVIKARWTRGEGSADFQTTIRISGIDELGMVNKISETVTAYQRVDIRSMQYDAQHGMFEAIMKVHVPNVNVLNGLIKRIGEIKGVMRANRLGIRD